MLITPAAGRLLEVVWAFLKLGLISFGGPVAHLGYFREEFVQRRRWLEDEAYGDLVALCQFLPGPASSQVVFALGMRRAGVVGAVVASFCFLLPSAVLMILFGYGVAAVGDLHRAGWLHGLKLAAVAVVAQAVWGMGRTLCPDSTRLTIGLGAAAILLVAPGAVAQIGVLAAGGMVGWSLYRTSRGAAERRSAGGWRGHLVAAMVLGVFVVLLGVLPMLASVWEWKGLAVFDSFYRAGSLVFGGGHVVLPLLRAEVVPKGWVNDSEFLAGYGAAQALPGPLFTFAAYLGSVMQPGSSAWAWGMWCVLAVFLPGWLLIGGALPFWERLRTEAWAQAGLRGANAAVVGLLLAALYNPVWTESVRGARDVAAVAVAFGLLQWWKAPAWLVVLLAACAGEWLLG